jgi:hypothetical protein
MLAVALALQLLSADPQAYAWDGKSPIRLELGQSIRLHIPKCCSHIAVSGFVFEANVVAADTLEIAAAGPGKSTLLAWTTDGTPVSAAIEVSPAPVKEWDGRSAVRLVVGKPVLLHVPKISRLAVSVGMGPYDLKSIGNDTIELTGQAPGKGIVLGWRSDETRFQIELEIVEPPPAAQAKVRAGERVMVTIPEELVDLREAPRDGGTLLIGTGASGARYEISVTPLPKKR